MKKINICMYWPYLADLFCTYIEILKNYIIYRERVGPQKVCQLCPWGLKGVKVKIGQAKALKCGHTHLTLGVLPVGRV